MPEYSRRELISTIGAGAMAATSMTAVGRSRATSGATPPKTRWNRTYSTGVDAETVSVTRASDGEFVAAGTTAPEEADGERSLWLFRLDSAGSIVWERTFREDPITEGTDVVSTGDGFVAVGNTRPLSGESQRGFAIKVDGAGNERWRKTYSRSYASTDTIEAAVHVDGGFFFAGGSKPLDDAWLLSASEDGSRNWMETYGGSNSDWFYGVSPGNDGGCMAVGRTQQGSGNDRHAWATEMSNTGNVQWTERFRIPHDDINNPKNNHNVFYDAIRDDGEGYYAVGESAVTKDSDEQVAWVVHINSSGQQLEDLQISEDSFNSLRAVRRDGMNYYAVGETAGNRNRENRRGLAYSFNFVTAERFRKTVSAKAFSALYGVTKSGDGGLVAVGNAEPSYRSESTDGWSVKVGGDPVETPTATPTATPTDTPADTPTDTPSDGRTETATRTETQSTPVTDAPTDTTTATQSGGTSPTTTADESSDSGGGLPLPLIGGGVVAAALGAAGYIYYSREGGGSGDTGSEGGGPGPSSGAATQHPQGGQSRGGDQPQQGYQQGGQQGGQQPQGGQPNDGYQQSGQPQQGGQPQQDGQPQEGSQPQQGGQPQQDGQPQQGGRPDAPQGGEPTRGTEPERPPEGDTGSDAGSDEFSPMGGGSQPDSPYPGAEGANEGASDSTRDVDSGPDTAGSPAEGDGESVEESTDESADDR